MALPELLEPIQGVAPVQAEGDGPPLKGFAFIL